MKKLSSGERRLIAEFLSNIGVAWFATGVISAFAPFTGNLSQIVVSIVWGLLFSFGFLRIGLLFAKGVKL